MRDPGGGSKGVAHDPFEIAPELERGAMIAGLPARHSADADTDQGTRRHDQNQFEVCNLFVGIEDGDQQQASEGARQGDSCDLGRDDDRSPRAFVRIGQMPLASGTGGHQEWLGSRRHNNTGRRQTRNDTGHRQHGMTQATDKHGMTRIRIRLPPR